jgi:iron complex outermembrane receptor protein
MMRGPKDATRGRSLLPALLWMAAVPAMAAAPHPASPQATVLPTVVVTATRAPQRAFDVPASVKAVSLDTPGANRPAINPSESLREVPGVMARDRQNYAQDE